MEHKPFNTLQLPDCDKQPGKMKYIAPQVVPLTPDTRQIGKNAHTVEVHMTTGSLTIGPS